MFTILCCLQIPTISSIAYTMSGRHQMQNKEEMPGPGSYCPEKVTLGYLISNLVLTCNLYWFTQSVLLCSVVEVNYQAL